MSLSLAAFELASSVIALLVCATTWTRRFLYLFQSREEVKILKTKEGPWTTIFAYQQLLITVVESVISVVWATTHNGNYHITMAPEALLVLFGSLVWLSMSFGLSISAKEFGREYRLPWMILALAYVAVATRVTIDHGSHQRVHRTLLVWCRAGIALIMVLSTKPHFPLRRRQLDGEAQPLLAVTANTARTPLWKPMRISREVLLRVLPRNVSQYQDLLVFMVGGGLSRVSNIIQVLALAVVAEDLQHALLAEHLCRHLSIFLFFRSLQSVFSSTSRSFYLRLLNELHMNLADYCYVHTIKLSADFHLSKSTPETTHIIDKAKAAVELVLDSCLDILAAIVDLVSAVLVVGHLFGGLISFVAVVAILLLIRVGVARSLVVLALSPQYLQTWEDYCTHLTQTLTCWTTVSMASGIDREIDRNRQLVGVFRDTFRAYLNRIWLLSLFQEAVPNAGLALCTYLLIGCEDTTRCILILYTYWDQFFAPVTTLANSPSDVLEKIVTLRKLLVLLSKRPSITDPVGASDFDCQEALVAFDDCSFTYDGEREVLKGLSFVVQSGTILALVGETGGGKSTVLQLMQRFYDPVRGRVLVDDQDLKQLRLDSYKEHIAIVSQQPDFFNNTIMFNLKYSRPEATDDEVYRACKIAQIHDKIESFPNKYEERVGERGQNLSGGERQRLGIARALVQNARILVLDEATSAIDSLTEKKLYEALEDAIRGKTVITIAHRLSTTRAANRILVLHNGRIVEQGKHEELLEKEDGRYRAMWEAQVRDR